MKNEIVLFEAKDGKFSLPVQLNEETVWLTRMQMAELFGVTPQNITLHLQNVYKTGELKRAATSKDFLLVQQEGNRSISRMVNVYNLDAIISVGYRVNSARATQFRIWATKVLKEYLVRGYALNRERLKQLGMAVDVMKRKERIDKMKKRMRMLVCAVAAMVSAGVSLGGMGTNGVLIASHRADWKLAPENSLAALENAIRYGVDIVETDVRRTKNGVLVILHDPHVGRVTNGQGYVADMTLEEIKRLNLRDALGQTTTEKIPTLEEYMMAAKGRVRLYLDKAGQDGGALVPQIIGLAKKCGTLEETVFVLDWPYGKARKVFGDDLEKVLYCPVIEDKIANLDAYVDEWLANFKPFAFQFRFASTDTRTFALLPKVLASGTRAFVAATWRNHTAGHDDRVSLMSAPDDGWGWLVANGFTILETNFPREMKSWLKDCEINKGNNP